MPSALVTAANVHNALPVPVLHAGVRDHVPQSNNYVLFNQFWELNPPTNTRGVSDMELVVCTVHACLPLSRTSLKLG